MRSELNEKCLESLAEQRAHDDIIVIAALTMMSSCALAEHSRNQNR